MQRSPVNGMDFLWMLLVLAGEFGILFELLHLAWTTHYYLSNTNIPHAICRPGKLKLSYFVLIWLFSLDYILWKIGICNNEYTIVKLLLDVFPPSKDPSLFISHQDIEGIPVRIYQPKTSQTQQRGIVFMHGGAGTLGSLDSYERLCRYIAKESNSVVLSIGYSLVPDQPYPVQFEQCLDVTVYFMKHAEDYGVDPCRIIICGDSFGGILAATICQMMVQRKDIPRLRAQMLIYPFLQVVKHSLPSYMQNARVPILTKKQGLKFALQYLQKNISLQEVVLQGAHVPKEKRMKYKKWLSPDNIPDEFKFREVKALPDPKHPFGEIKDLIDQLCGPLLSPLLVENSILQQLPETFILTVQYDILRDDAILYKKRLEDNGVLVSWCHLEDGFHGSVALINNWVAKFPCAVKGAEHVVNYIRGL
uniref:Arylacetamide deacetylase-like 4 n=1 Tax=Pogona vitticeps TaxID=103695 RepID=A0A6J0U6U2_9SAUR